MIPDSGCAVMSPEVPPTGWKRSLAQAVRDPVDLLRRLGLDADPALTAAARRAALRFPLRVPQAYIARMHRGDINDPLLRQVLPLAEELQSAPGYGNDAVGDLQAMTRPGLLHKYYGRVLLVTTGACAVHCRYCFRREFPYADADPKRDGWQQALRYIAGDPSISELILSGGDPLTLTDNHLETLIRRCEQIPHLQRLRIHSRLPVVLPERITESLCAILDGTRLQITHVIHANHAQEIDKTVAQAVERLYGHSRPVYNQAVLLKGVNDSVTALRELCESLVTIGVQPYYLHLLDRVNGVHHFEVDNATARSLVQKLSGLLPGYMLPRLVREQPGEPAKTPVDTGNVGNHAPGGVAATGKN